MRGCAYVRVCARTRQRACAYIDLPVLLVLLVKLLKNKGKSFTAKDTSKILMVTCLSRVLFRDRGSKAK